MKVFRAQGLFVGYHKGEAWYADFVELRRIPSKYVPHDSIFSFILLYCNTNIECCYIVFELPFSHPWGKIKAGFGVAGEDPRASLSAPSSRQDGAELPGGSAPLRFFSP